MADPHPLVGRSIEDLDTPVLLVDLPSFEANIEQMAGTCRRLGIGWRPHAKGHKSLHVARRLLAAGAIGLTCAKLSEAEIFVAAGIGEILLANQVASTLKAGRLARLQRRGRVLGIVDQAEAVALLGAAAKTEGVCIPLLIDVDIGMHRTGVEPGPQVGALAQLISDDPALCLEGIMGYEGHTYRDPPATKAGRCAAALEDLQEARRILQAGGHDVKIVSAGGTGSYECSASMPGLTELQAGGGILMDAMYRDACHVGGDLRFALTLLTTVSGVHAGHVVTDAGFKTLSAFHHPPRVLDMEGLEFGYLSAEHGVYRLAPGAVPPAFGQRLRLLPGYHDSTTCLHDEFVCVRDGLVEEVWPLSARGALT